MTKKAAVPLPAGLDNPDLINAVHYELTGQLPKSLC